MASKTCWQNNGSSPFRSNTLRFDSIGYHPGLDVTGIVSNRKSKLAPGQYNPEKFECLYKKCNAEKSSWRRKTEVEEFSKNLGFRNPLILAEKMYWKATGGPGNYNTSLDCFKRCRKVRDNIGFGRGERNLNVVRHNNPPPGTYRIDKKSTMVRKQFTHVPSFEWDGFIDRFKSTETAWAKAPNRYTPKEYGSIESRLSKVVSKKGPYDLFTGPRDGTTIKNHFAPPAFKGPLNYFYTFPKELDILLHHPRKRRLGLFLKEERFSKATLRHMVADTTLCYRDPSWPSAATYDIEPEKTPKQNPYAFNQSVLYATPPIKWLINPGVGRYNPRQHKCSKGRGGTWVFKSKVKREGPKVDDVF